MSTRVRLPAEHAVLLRVRTALRASLTKGGHLAQRVGHEYLGYCSTKAESDRCTEMRALIDDVDALIEGLGPGA